MEEEEMMDEDVFLEETLLREEEEEEIFILQDEEDRKRALSIWKRPNLSSSYISHSNSIIFQQLEIDYVIGERNRELLPYSSGVTREGHSVCCNIHGFEPYFYVSCPQGMGPDDVSRFHHILESKMKEANRNSTVPQFILRIEMVQKKSIMYYQQQQSHIFLKIVVALPTMVAGC